MDAAQEARRARMFAQQGPEYHMQQAREAIFLAMGGQAIEPYKLIANAVGDATKALELGMDEGDLDCMPAIARLPGDERFLESYRIVASGVEAEALRRHLAAQTESTAEPVTA